jgi:hypothetical protein
MAASVRNAVDKSTWSQMAKRCLACAEHGFEVLALLVDCQILFVIDPNYDKGLRPSEGDISLVLWDFHDLLFHARSTTGRCLRREPSEKQAKWLHAIYCRIGRRR